MIHKLKQFVVGWALIGTLVVYLVLLAVVVGYNRLRVWAGRRWPS